ncbi:MAG: LacI family DNA-binding transcriptional regulator [Rhizobiaceae bacterium]|nr:LacI family DNA-binding transcriptional regulator [Rhizobiaceae bacterium]
MGVSAKKRPTISDVAKLAKVSTATVSRALQTPDLVSQSTRDQVLDAVKRTNYRINSAAKMLRQNRAATLLVLLPDIANPFFSEILSGIEDIATERDHTILIGNTNGEEARTHDLLDLLQCGRADGALLLNGALALPPDEVEALALISISAEIPVANISHVGIDNVGALQEITNHLISLGHRNIVHICGPAGNILSSQRRTGYEQAMLDSGLGEYNRTISGGFTVQDGKAAVGELLKSGDLPTALVCANDDAAIGAILELKQNGLSVPQDVSVSGFDDVPIASLFSPAITTIRQRRKEIGQQAARLLFEELSASAMKPQKLMVDHELVLRDSTCAPRKDA